MINIKQNTLSLIIFLSLFGCIDPNNDDLWSISIDATLETNGFARDISINGNNALAQFYELCVTNVSIFKRALTSS